MKGRGLRVYLVFPAYLEHYTTSYLSGIMGNQRLTFFHNIRII